MAKWGEGDPRWIVEQRPDATNVNNWHWSEKNADKWSKAKLRSLLDGLVLTEEPKTFVDSVDRIEGEARVANRKGKLSFFYEWDIRLNWKGILVDETGDDGDNKEICGTVEVPNLCEDFHDCVQDVEVNVTKDDTSLAQTFPQSGDYELMRMSVRGALQSYINALETEYSQTGLILPTKDKK